MKTKPTAKEVRVGFRVTPNLEKFDTNWVTKSIVDGLHNTDIVFDFATETRLIRENIFCFTTQELIEIKKTLELRKVYDRYNTDIFWGMYDMITAVINDRKGRSRK